MHQFSRMKSIFIIAFLVVVILLITFFIVTSVVRLRKNEYFNDPVRHIPRRIFQTWNTKVLPSKIQSSVDEMLRLNPTYTYRLFDDDEMKHYIAQNFDQETNLAYSMLNVGAAKADFWRYLVLFKEGGIYLDIDSVIYNSLDLLIANNDRAIISRENAPFVFLQWCLMFEASHPILELTIRKSIHNIINKTTNDLMYLAGPKVFSHAINELLQNSIIDPYHQNDLDMASVLHDFCRFFGTDFPGFCSFKHAHARELYESVTYWRDETKIFT
jgi:mannosyltransferase OCH1-like enzyme